MDRSSRDCRDLVTCSGVVDGLAVSALVGRVEANDLVAIEGIGEIDLDLDKSLLNEMLLCIGLLFVLKWSSVYPDRYFNATADSNE